MRDVARCMLLFGIQKKHTMHSRVWTMWWSVKVYERFETACDDLDSGPGLFQLDLDQPHCSCCSSF
jgi:hypothetical protein